MSAVGSSTQTKFWKDTLQKGTFRGVAFEWTRAELEFGRYTVTHVFPRADRNVREDMGRRERDFSLELLVTSTTPGTYDYAARRDALIAAVETAGPGQLVHPLFGTLNVAVLRGRVSESTEEGGVARFWLTFGEDGSKDFNPATSASADTKKAVDKAADQSIAASIRSFASSLSISNLTSTFQSLAGDTVGGALSTLKGLIGQGTDIIGAVGQVVGTVQQDASSVLGWVGGANLLGLGGGLGSVTALLNLPGALGAALASQVAGLSFTGALASLGDPVDAFWSGLSGPVPDDSSDDVAASSSTTTVSVARIVPGTVASISGIVAGTSTFPATLAPVASWDPAALTPLLTVVSVNGTASPPASWADIRAGAYTPATIAGIVDLQNQVAAYEADIPYSPDAPTPARAQAIANDQAIQDLVQQQALVQVAQATVAASYASADEAETARDAIAGALDTVAQNATDPAIYAAFSALRLAVVADLTQVAMQLPNLRRYTPRVTMPALALAHRLYDDPSYADDIVARNDVAHPLFVPGGVALEILAGAGIDG